MGGRITSNAVIDDGMAGLARALAVRHQAGASHCWEPTPSSVAVIILAA